LGGCVEDLLVGGRGGAIQGFVVRPTVQDSVQGSFADASAPFGSGDMADIVARSVVSARCFLAE